MKIVLDTNVIISGLLFPDSKPGLIVQLVASGYIELCYDSRIILEYQNVLKRPKFSFKNEDISNFINQIKAKGHLVASKPVNLNLPDEDDLKFLEVALESPVTFLVTGNLKHFPEKEYQKLKFVSPTEFIKILRK